MSLGREDVGAVYLARRQDDARSLADGAEAVANQVEVEGPGAEAVGASEKAVSQAGDGGPLRDAPARLHGHAVGSAARPAAPGASIVGRGSRARAVAGSHGVIL